MTNKQREMQNLFIESVAGNIKDKHLKESSYLMESIEDKVIEVYKHREWRDGPLEKCLNDKKWVQSIKHDITSKGIQIDDENEIQFSLDHALVVFEPNINDNFKYKKVVISDEDYDELATMQRKRFNRYIDSKTRKEYNEDDCKNMDSSISEDERYEKYSEVYDDYNGSVYPEVADQDYTKLPPNTLRKFQQLSKNASDSLQSTINSLEELMVLHKKYCKDSSYVKDDITGYFIDQDTQGRGWDLLHCLMELDSWANTFACVDQINHM